MKLIKNHLKKRKKFSGEEKVLKKILMKIIIVRLKKYPNLKKK